jgi:hypothetical protein
MRHPQTLPLHPNAILQALHLMKHPRWHRFYQPQAHHLHWCHWSICRERGDRRRSGLARQIAPVPCPPAHLLPPRMRITVVAKISALCGYFCLCVPGPLGRGRAGGWLVATCSTHAQALRQHWSRREYSAEFYTHSMAWRHEQGSLIRLA